MSLRPSEPVNTGTADGDYDGYNDGYTGVASNPRPASVDTAYVEDYNTAYDVGYAMGASDSANGYVNAYGL